MPFLQSKNGHHEAPPEEDHESRFDVLFSGEGDAESDTEESEGFDVVEEAEANPDLFDPTELEASLSEPEAEPDLDPAGEGESPFLRGEIEEELALAEEGEGEGEGEGEVMLLGEDESGSGEGQIVLLKKEVDDFEDEAAPAITPIHARILWPALGFPAVIAPRGNATGSPFSDGDAIRCVTVLLRSNRKNLSKAEAARYLRYVTWNDRGRRHIEAKEGTEGWFREEELAVRNNEAGPKLVIPTPKGSSGILIAFGGDRDGNNAITVNLANKVASFYDAQGLRYLHEIRVSEAASARLGGKQYHLFWNNQGKTEAVPSDEMALLLGKFADPRRAALGEVYEEQRDFLLGEYEWEYGLRHPPYHSDLRIRKIRTEVLHPLFVRQAPTGPLRIGHITDIHVDVRADVYEENLRRARSTAHYNNWNKSFLRVYQDAKERSDILLLTGDLIDYGRGHWGLNAGDRLGDDDAYHVDRNWFLFTYLLAGDSAYTAPAYTILGNHDWRLNPYPPFAPGAPRPGLLLHDYRKYTGEQQRQIIRLAHGPDHEKKFSYYTKAKSKLELLSEATGSALKALVRMFVNRQTLDEPHTPTETTVESVAWYLLSINPFLDYSFTLPGGQRVLMLDWAEDEDVLFPISVRGKSWPYLVWQVEQASDAGPKARTCLTPLQLWMTRDFAGRPGRSKVIGIHAPPIGPYSDWFDDDLYRGQKLYSDEKEPRGPTNYGTRYPDGRVERWNGHPLFAIRPKNGPTGVEADYCSFANGREAFINAVAKPGAGVRAVFSGHIHRNNLFLTYVSDARSGPAVAGQVRIRAVTPELARGKQGPLYVNTTSGGPRGNRYLTKGREELVDPGYARLELAADGTIEGVEFIAPPVPAPVQPAAGAGRRELEMVGAEADTSAE